eukprot:15365934-Ditylum_brightwellii.AAC.1
MQNSQEPITLYVYLNNQTTDKEEAPGPNPSDSIAALAITKCNVLVLWSCDPYYYVLISSYKRTPTIVKVMSMNLQHVIFQPDGCTAIASLSIYNGSNQCTVRADGGLHAMVSALRNHPTSVRIYSAVYDALMQLISIVHLNIDELLQTNGDIIELVGEAQSQVLPSQSQENIGIVKYSLSKKRHLYENLNT